MVSGETSLVVVADILNVCELHGHSHIVAGSKNLFSTLDIDNYDSALAACMVLRYLKK